MIVLEIGLGILGSLITAWFSRQREFRADYGGATLAGRRTCSAPCGGSPPTASWSTRTHQALATLKINGTRGLDGVLLHPPAARSSASRRSSAPRSDREPIRRGRGVSTKSRSGVDVAGVDLRRLRLRGDGLVGPRLHFQPVGARRHLDRVAAVGSGRGLEARSARDLDRRHLSRRQRRALVPGQHRTRDRAADVCWLLSQIHNRPARRARDAAQQQEGHRRLLEISCVAPRVRNAMPAPPNARRYTTAVHTTLITTDALASHLDAWAIIDCRYDLKDERWGRAEYLRSAIFPAPVTRASRTTCPPRRTARTDATLCRRPRR